MKPEEKKRALEIAAIIAAAGVILFISINTAEAKKLLVYVKTICAPFIYGGAIAFILNLVVKQIDQIRLKIAKKRGRKCDVKKHRGLSIVLSILAFVLFAGLTIGMIIPNLKNTIQTLYHDAPELWDKVLSLLDKFKVKQPSLAEYITKLENNLDGYYDKIISSLKGNLSNIASTAVSKIKSATNVLFNFALGVVIAFGVLLKKELLVKEFFVILKKLLPEKHYTRARHVIRLANKKFQIYFKYNLIQAVITGAGTFVVMLVSGMPYKVSIALLITVTQLIPIVGAIVGTGLSALLIAAVSPVKAIIFIVLSILVQQTVEKLINPHLMGKELEMPGVLTFLAIVIGGKQFGLIGLICSVPLVSIFYDLYTQELRPKIYSNKADKTKKIENE